MDRSLVVVIVWLLIGPSTVAAQPTAVIGRSYPGSPAFSFDADGAVGPGHYAEITNLGFRVTTLSVGNLAYSAGSLSEFFSTKVGLPLPTPCCFDPQLEYDHASGRWIALALGGAFSTNSSLYLGISVTSDPSGAWRGVIIDADPSNLRWADLPFLGLDAAAVYIAVGMPGIASGTAFGELHLVLPKGDLIAPVPSAARLSRFFTSFPTPTANDFHYGARPQIDYAGTATDGLHVQGANQPLPVVAGSVLRWAVDAVHQRISGQATGAATLLPWSTTVSYQFDSTSNPPPQTQPTDFGRQPGTTIRLNNGTGNNYVRVGDAVYSAASTFVRGRLGIVWRRFQPSTNTIVDAGFIGDDVHDYHSPSIAANVNGDVVIAYTRTSPTTYASFYSSAGRPDAGGKLVFAAPMLVKAGTDIYDENGPLRSPGLARFLDYASSVSVQPGDPSRFWVSGAYVSGRNVGSTWIAEIVMLGAPTVQTTYNGDILWRHTDGTAAKWVMNGLTISSSALLLGAGTGWGVARTGEFNASGSSDLVWQHGDGRSALWLMNGTSLTNGVGLLGPGTGWTVNRLGDFNGDGRKDIIWQRMDGSTALWLMNGLTLQAAATLVGPETGWSVQHAADFNGDGRDDLVWLHPGGTTAIWLMDGVNLGGSAVVRPGGTGWAVKATGDFNGDGRSDLVWQHSDGSAALWLMEGTTAIGTGVLVGPGTGWAVKGVGRFNADGNDDLIWEHSSGTTALWLMNGVNLNTAAVLLGAGTGWRLQGIADLNADGKGDLLWKHTNGATAGWLMDGISLSSGGLLVGAGTGWSPIP